LVALLPATVQVEVGALVPLAPTLLALPVALVELEQRHP
jgi:hypothetical protein